MFPGWVYNKCEAKCKFPTMMKLFDFIESKPKQTGRAELVHIIVYTPVLTKRLALFTSQLGSISLSWSKHNSRVSMTYKKWDLANFYYAAS